VGTFGFVKKKQETPVEIIVFVKNKEETLVETFEFLKRNRRP
jgi:hypothetical protein